MFVQMTDEQLCHCVREGSRDAEQELALRYMRFVRACTRPFFLAGGDREDLLQEGMIGLVMAIREFDPTRFRVFKVFAGRCIRNRILSAIKKASGMKQLPLTNYLSFDSLSLSTDALDAPLSPEDFIVGQESFAEFRVMLQGLLSPLERQVLAYYLEGLSYQEISVALAKPSKAIDNAVQRIRRKLSATPHQR